MLVREQWVRLELDAGVDALLRGLGDRLFLIGAQRRHDVDDFLTQGRHHDGFGGIVPLEAKDKHLVAIKKMR